MNMINATETRRLLRTYIEKSQRLWLELILDPDPDKIRLLVDAANTIPNIYLMVGALDQSGILETSVDRVAAAMEEVYGVDFDNAFEYIEEAQTFLTELRGLID